MPTIINLSTTFTTQKRLEEFFLNLSEISRTKAFKITTEVITLLSLLTAGAIWILALPTL